VIRRGDSVASVLGRNRALLDVFVAASPHFERLRQPAMRRVMARLVTVEQAARVAGVNPDDLVDRLNAGEAGSARRSGTPAEGGAKPMEEGQLPAELRNTPPERIVDLDVRDDLRHGREPFSRIMAARGALREGDVLRLRAIFEPAPLYAVMRKQGYAHWTEQLAADDWRVWFYRAQVEGDLPSAGGGVGTDAAPPVAEGDDVVVLDVRGLEPPEPMVRTLAALETLPPGGTLVQVNARVPRHLLPKLEALGFSYEVHEQQEELVRVFIRRRDRR
jgi:uncharacterized protein (DUF2249 family)